MQIVLGQGAILAFLAILDFPSSGGAISPVLLPTFWHVLNRFWIGGGGFHAFRSIIYFGGQGIGGDALKLLAWLGVGVVLLALAAWLKAGRQRARQDAGPSYRPPAQPRPDRAPALT